MTERPEPKRKVIIELAFDRIIRDNTGTSRLIDFGDKEVWIPYSQTGAITDNTIEVQEWLAKKEGLI